MPSHRPSLDEFRRLASDSSRVPVYRELTSDGLTPVSAFRRLARSGPAFLFESVVGGEKVGRFSAMGTEPSLRFEARGSEIRLYRGNEAEPFETRVSQDPFADLQVLLDQRRSVKLRNLPRFTGGAVGFAAYDSVRYTENLPDAPPDDRGLPDLAFGFYDSLVIFDHIRKTILVIAQADCSEGQDIDQARSEAEARVDELVKRLSEPFAEPPPVDIDTSGPITLQPKSNFTRDQYEDVVRRCQEYIKAGDIFQVVPSQRFQIETTAEPFDIYRVLRVVNPSPFLFYLPFNGYHLIGCSPEILVRVDEGEVTIRPIAGTRRRGRDEEEDRALAEELLADPKETGRAHHARRPRPQRRGPRGRPIHREAHRADVRGALQPRHAHHLQRGRPALRGKNGV